MSLFLQVSVAAMESGCIPSSHGGGCTNQPQLYRQKKVCFKSLWLEFPTCGKWLSHPKRPRKVSLSHLTIYERRAERKVLNFLLLMYFFPFFFFMFCFFLTVKGHKYLRTKHFDIITRSTKLKWTCISLYCWTRGNLSFRLSPTWEQRLWTEIYSSPCIVSFDVVAVQFLF